MTGMDRAQVVAGLDTEFGLFADLLDALKDTDRDAATRCAGWQVRDVAAHVTANALDSADGTIGTRTPDDQARALRDTPPRELAALLREAAARLTASLARLDDRVWQSVNPRFGRTVANGVLTLWYDAFVHADDIRTALGHPRTTDGPGLAASETWLRAELQRLGRPHAATATAPAADPMAFVLAASGRLDPALIGLDHDVNVYSVR
ncbi:maleylpyruvate isomerase family mycothiol-dependent enzyme [Kitasatospora sp. NPDC059722]|uniref:maleylpyruvate isomerase family mycothiol-dependent enzyme n=1 Tax=Kitasatospora sp. NPDC059722 TaxID=3346925 RepID=UPI00369E3BD1